MAKRRKSRKVVDFITRYPNHHIVVDAKSRSLIGSGRSVRNARSLLNRLTNRLFRKLGELQYILDIDGDVIAAEVHTVVDDRVPVEQIGRGPGLRPTWHGIA